MPVIMCTRIVSDNIPTYFSCFGQVEISFEAGARTAIKDPSVHPKQKKSTASVHGAPLPVEMSGSNLPKLK